MAAVDAGTACLARPPVIRIMILPGPVRPWMTHVLHDEGGSLPGSPRRRLDYGRPLRPLRTGDLARYLDISDYKVRFDEFKDILNGQDSWLSKGHVFIVAGDRQYGKTSLRQRCGYWMRNECARDDCEVVVVDLSDQGWEDANSDDRLSLIRDQILSEISGYFAPAVIERLASRDKLEIFFWELGRTLRARGLAADNDEELPIVLVVLLPGYPNPVEIERCYRLAQEGMVFIAELFKQDAIKDIGEKIGAREEPFTRDGIDAKILPLGALDIDDVLLLTEWVQDDLRKRMRDDPGNCPILVNDGFKVALNDYAGRNYKVGVGELMELLVAVVGYVMEGPDNEAVANHIVRYYADGPGFGHD